MREETEKRKVVDRWLKEEKAEKQKKMQDFLQRLSEQKRSVPDAKAETLRREMESRLRSARARAEKQAGQTVRRLQGNSPSTRSTLCMTRKIERIESKIQTNRMEYESELAKRDLRISAQREAVSESIQLKKEARDKRILRSKVHTLLTKEVGIVCERHRMAEQRFCAVMEKGGLRRSIRAETISPRLAPDEVLFERFDGAELKQVT